MGIGDKENLPFTDSTQGDGGEDDGGDNDSGGGERRRRGRWRL